MHNQAYLIDTFFEEMYTTGAILETSYNTIGIPKDTNSFNETVERNNNPKSENQHRSKILSASTQIKHRCQLIN